MGGGTPPELHQRYPNAAEPFACHTTFSSSELSLGPCHNSLAPPPPPPPAPRPSRLVG